MLRGKLQEGCYTVQWLENTLQRCGNHCENLIVLQAMLFATKMLREFIFASNVTPYNFASNLNRNKIA